MVGSVEIGARSVGLEEVRRVAEGAAVTLAPQARERLVRGREALEILIGERKGIFYGINTGFGSLKNIRIPAEKIRVLQTNLIRSHAVGVGPELSRATVRAMMLLRAVTLTRGHSGVRPQVVEQLMEMLNQDVVPVVPSQGSVGASGDLAPLAHLALGMTGEGDARYRGERTSASDALRTAKIKPFQPEAKEALALLNGTQMMTAIGVLSLLRAEQALKHADIAAAMTLEATLGSSRAFDEKVHRLRPHPGQTRVASHLRRLHRESEIAVSHQDCDRVQDAYSLRCTPQVHGAAWDMLTHVRAVLECEVQSVTDNPLLFPEEGEVISAGNFHGQPVALVMDAMALALTPVASISERRSARLLNPTLSGLPAGLVEQAGLHSGMMMLQVTAASLVNECKTLSHPASVDSIPTWADQEDHVSMGAYAARKAEQVVDALERVIGIELLCAAQGVEFRKPLKPSRAVQKALRDVRKISPRVGQDRYLGPDLQAITDLVKSGKLLETLRDEFNLGT